MALHLLKDRGVPIERQRFNWRELAPPTISKVDCDAWIRIPIWRPGGELVLPTRPEQAAKAGKVIS